MKLYKLFSSVKYCQLSSGGATCFRCLHAYDKCFVNTNFANQRKFINPKSISFSQAHRIHKFYRICEADLIIICILNGISIQFFFV
jgi:hypothetical protein